MEATSSRPRPLVHLELHTHDRAGATAFYKQVLAWKPEAIETRAGSYLALDLGANVSGGIVECGTPRPLWLPYIEVDEIEEHTARARGLGARVLLEPRRCPTGWRSVVSTQGAGEIAFWQPKR